MRIPAIALEDVLDRLLPLVPAGVREVPVGRDIELRMRGDELPEPQELAVAIGEWPAHISELQVPDDWRERRAADYMHEVIARRLVVRPEWAPPAPRPGRNSGLLEIVLAESQAFGAGTHPTTRTVLELLLDMRVAGAFADLGSGSGVIAILAARLGWSPVLAADRDPRAVGTTRANAELNGVAIATVDLDLESEPPPAADGFAANVPSLVHPLIAAALPDPLPEAGIISGFAPAEADAVISAYAGRGLTAGVRIDVHGWVVALLRR